MQGALLRGRLVARAADQEAREGGPGIGGQGNLVLTEDVEEPLPGQRVQLAASGWMTSCTRRAASAPAWPIRRW